MIFAVKIKAWAGSGLLWLFLPFSPSNAAPYYNDDKSGQGPQWTACRLLYFWKFSAYLGTCYSQWGPETA